MEEAVVITLIVSIYGFAKGQSPPYEAKKKLQMTAITRTASKEMQKYSKNRNFEFNISSKLAIKSLPGKRYWETQ